MNWKLCGMVCLLFGWYVWVSWIVWCGVWCSLLRSVCRDFVGCIFCGCFSLLCCIFVVSWCWFIWCWCDIVDWVVFGWMVIGFWGWCGCLFCFWVCSIGLCSWLNLYLICGIVMWSWLFVWDCLDKGFVWWCFWCFFLCFIFFELLG